MPAPPPRLEATARRRVATLTDRIDKAAAAAVEKWAAGGRGSAEALAALLEPQLTAARLAARAEGAAFTALLLEAPVSGVGTVGPVDPSMWTDAVRRYDRAQRQTAKRLGRGPHVAEAATRAVSAEVRGMALREIQAQHNLGAGDTASASGRRIVGWQLRPSGDTCGLCVSRATRLTRRPPRPTHNRCDCLAVPVTDTDDPAGMTAPFRQIYSRTIADTVAAADAAPTSAKSDVAIDV